MTKEQILFIINPNAGKRQQGHLPHLIEKHLDHQRYDYKISFTAYAGHASEIISQHPEYDIFVAVGGDGTVNEIASSLVGSEKTLTIIPKGSGNGFARYLGMPMNEVKAIQFINKAQAQSFDHGTINEDHVFLATAGFGFDAEVALDFSLRKNRGLWNYLKAIISLYRSYPAFETELILDDAPKKTIKAWMLTFGNGNQWGNNAYVCPNADAQDGLLDITWVAQPLKWYDAPYFGLLLLMKKLHQHSKVKSLRCEKALITTYQGAYHFDGEPLQTVSKSFRISLKNKNIKVLTKQ